MDKTRYTKIEEYPPICGHLFFTHKASTNKISILESLIQTRQLNADFIC